MRNTCIKASLIAIVVIASFAAVSSASAADFYISVGTGSYPYYGNYFNSYGGYYGGSYFSASYNSSNYWGFNYDFSHDSFWDGGNVNGWKAPRRANVTPITISGLGFATPAQGSTVTPTPVQGAPAVTQTLSVNCPSGQSYNAGMNICLPVRY